MKARIVLLVLHLFLVIMSIVNSAITNNDISRALYIISGVCWAILFIDDTIKLT